MALLLCTKLWHLPPTAFKQLFGVRLKCHYGLMAEAK